MDNEDDFALWVLLDELLTNSRECQLLSIQHDLHEFTSGWDHLNRIDARQDLDNLLLGLNSLGGDCNWNVPGSVQEKYMLTVIDLVWNSHVIEGADKGGLNAAGGWNVITSHLEGSNLHWVSQGSGWEEEPGKAHETNVP